MEKLKGFLVKLNIEDVDEKLIILEGYMNGLLQWNEKVNLTAITDREEFVQKHFVDSLLCVTSREFNGAEYIIDVGTGGGFPGVPLAVCFPQKRFVLMDSTAKRLNIVKDLCEKQGILNVETVHGRAEDLARLKEYREKFDLCLSRAVANMSTLSEYCLPFVKRGGSFIAYKGSDCENEVELAKKAMDILGGSLDRIESSPIDNGYFDHKLVYVYKKRSTGNKFPRKAGTPAKTPIV